MKRQEVEELAKKAGLKLSQYNFAYHVEEPSRKGIPYCIERVLYSGTLKEISIFLRGYIEGKN